MGRISLDLSTLFLEHILHITAVSLFALRLTLSLLGFRSKSNIKQKTLLSSILAALLGKTRYIHDRLDKSPARQTKP